LSGNQKSKFKIQKSFLLRPQPKNVATYVATFRAKNLGKTVFVATLQPLEGIGIPQRSVLRALVLLGQSTD
jgi:hypothetical protein